MKNTIRTLFILFTLLLSTQVSVLASDDNTNRSTNNTPGNVTNEQTQLNQDTDAQEPSLRGDCWDLYKATGDLGFFFVKCVVGCGQLLCGPCLCCLCVTSNIVGPEVCGLDENSSYLQRINNWFVPWCTHEESWPCARNINMHFNFHG